MNRAFQYKPCCIKMKNYRLIIIAGKRFVFFALKLFTTTRTPRCSHRVKVSSISSQNRPLPWCLSSCCMRRYIPFISFLFWDLPHKRRKLLSEQSGGWAVTCTTLWNNKVTIKHRVVFKANPLAELHSRHTRWAESFHKRRLGWATPIIKTIGLFRRGRQ